MGIALVDFENLSIRARLGYSITCLERAFQKENINNDSIHFLLEQLWKFVSSSRFDLWHEIAEELMPSFVLSEENFDVLDLEKGNELKQQYLKMPEYITDLIEEVIWVGISNLYGAYKSSISLSYVEAVLLIMQKNNVDLPSLSFFENTASKLHEGWGLPFLSPRPFQLT